MRPDARLFRIAERQFGVFSLPQALTAGMSQHNVLYRVRTGRWTRLYRGVYQVAGAPTSREARLCAAILAAGRGACASHGTAAAVIGLAGVGGDGPIHLSVPGRRRVRLPGLTVHRPLQLPRSDVVRSGAIAYTTPQRTLLDLAPVIDALALEEALDDALRRRLVQVRPLEDRVRSSRRSGAGGTGVLADLLADRRGPIAGSALETRFLRLLRAARLPEPERQHEIRRAGRMLARVDFAYPAQRIAIELDGYAFHSGRRNFEADHARQNRIVEAGWLPLRVTARQIADGPDDVIASLRRALARGSRVTS